MYVEQQDPDDPECVPRRSLWHLRLFSSQVSFLTWIAFFVENHLRPSRVPPAQKSICEKYPTLSNLPNWPDKAKYKSTDSSNKGGEFGRKSEHYEMEKL